MNSFQPKPASPAPTTSRRRRWLRLAGFVAAVMLVLITRPAWHLAIVAWSDRSERSPIPAGEIDDASRLNQTHVAEVVDVPVDTENAETQLAELLQRARREGLKVSIAGARHSMGGHTIYPGGISLNMLPLNHMELNEDRDILRVGAGALWCDVIPYLDQRGRSVAVMQSNNSFSVGGSLSVNCHGWQYARPPIASTVKSFRLMKADGSIATCSRAENADLFSLALGGYGLFGIILDAELKVVPNRRYLVTSYVVPAVEAISIYRERIGMRTDAAMVYARFNVTPDRFLEDVVLNVYTEDADPNAAIPPLEAAGLSGIRRTIFRGSAESDYGKELRWTAETKLHPHLRRSVCSRNQLLNESVAVFENRQAESTDILHEYFVPPDRIEFFVERVRTIVPACDCDLLNVTVRSIEQDDDTFLRYADRPMLSLVMLFHQRRTTEAEAAMERMTRQLIDAAMDEGGRYYLPYRLHATAEQFHAAYPMAAEFFALKRRHDPDEVFQNQFYRKYGKPDVGSQAN
jgi:FAD/FMN-containing dehydrogenase